MSSNESAAEEFIFAGTTITFKSTLKGINKLADSSFGDLWMPFLSALIMIVTLGFGIQKLATGPTVITTLAISVVWIVYGLVPPYLLFHYAMIGRGSTLKFMSRSAPAWNASTAELLPMCSIPVASLRTSIAKTSETVCMQSIPSIGFLQLS